MRLYAELGLITFKNCKNGKYNQTFKTYETVLGYSAQQENEQVKSAHVGVGDNRE
jgi:hypothetical protein